MMRLSAVPTPTRSLFAVTLLGAMLVFASSVQAEPNQSGVEADPPSIESVGETPGAEAPIAENGTKTPSAETKTTPPGAEGSNPPDAQAGTPGSVSGKKPNKQVRTNPKAKPAKPTSDGEQAADEGTEPVSKVLVNIDKPTQEMTVFVDGVEQYSWPVSTGLPGYSTPSGTYTTSSMNKMWYSKQWDNAPMPHAIFFTKRGHAIHGTLETKKLGNPASHGCVRLSPENASTLFALVGEKGLENTEVVLNGDTPGGEYVSAQAPRTYSGYARPPRGYAYPPWFNPEDFGKRKKYTRRGWFQPFYSGPPGYFAPPQQRRRRLFRD
jgi:lipoprotein-anchoring transpeptidase ErfK/SrfK